MKKLSILIGMAVFCLSITTSVFAQTEIKGSGTTAATHALITTNSNSPVDTSMVVLDDGNVGIGTVSPASPLEVNGIIHSSSGGIMFPDNSVQATAASGGSVAYQNVITVAQSGGDFNTINAALGSLPIPPPLMAGNAWHIRVMPGIYTESFTLPKYVHLKGAGKYTTYIDGTVTLSDTCSIEDFNILQGILCHGTSPTILHNIITNSSDNLHGIWVTAGGDPWIIENEILNCSGWGIFIGGFGTDPLLLGNKILKNSQGGIKCEDSSPTISNNRIVDNSGYGIYLIGGDGTPSEPTIDDNVIGSTDLTTAGIGIYMQDYAEPRIIANDIYLCEWGIRINTQTPQPSIIGNNINYNYEYGIFCASKGATKPVVIKSNHIHSNGNPNAINPAGIMLSGEIAPIISHNNIHNNFHNPATGFGSDIDYSACPGLSMIPMISLNVYDIIIRSGAGVIAGGSYNVDSLGAPIGP